MRFPGASGLLADTGRRRLEHFHDPAQSADSQPQVWALDNMAGLPEGCQAVIVINPAESRDRDPEYPDEISIALVDGSGTVRSQMKFRNAGPVEPAIIHHRGEAS